MPKRFLAIPRTKVGSSIFGRSCAKKCSEKWIVFLFFVARFSSECFHVWRSLSQLGGMKLSVWEVSKIARNCDIFSQRRAPAEWNFREIFRFSHRFWREILVKFSVAHPNPGKRSTENFTKISRQISRQLWQRKTEKNFTSALLQGGCSDFSGGSRPGFLAPPTSGVGGILGESGCFWLWVRKQEIKLR